MGLDEYGHDMMVYSSVNGKSTSNTKYVLYMYIYFLLTFLHKIIINKGTESGEYIFVSGSGESLEVTNCIVNSCTCVPQPISRLG